MINVTLQILNFRNFLLHSWHDLDLLMSNHNWDDDASFTLEWLEANWEFLVERELLEKGNFLRPYYYTNRRITYPNEKPTYEIICKAKPGNYLIDDKNGIKIPNDIQLIFGGYVSRQNPGYGWYPPFNYVTLFTSEKKELFRAQIETLEFFICKI